MDRIFKSKFLFLLVVMGLAICMGMASVSTVSADNPAQSPQPTSRPPEESPAPAEPAAPALDAASHAIVTELARRAGIPAERLLVGYSEAWKLPFTGVSFTYVKAVDTVTGENYALGLDAAGRFVDPEALRAAEQAAYTAAFGKLHPALVAHLQGLAANETVQVSIWLSLGGREAWLPRPALEEARAMSAEEIAQYKADNLAYAAQVLGEVEAPLLKFLPSVGGRLISAADNAPIVFAELPAGAIQQLADLPYVQVIDLLVQGGPEEDGGEKGGGPEMATARPASKANIVEARGFTGAGVSAVVVEGDSIEFANPYIVDGTCGPTSTCPSLAEHATAVGGILASTHSSARGTAPGIGNLLLSANGGSWNLAEMQTATTWALGQGGDVFNNSYYLEIDGVMHNSDRWMDYLVRNSWVLEVKSAGNRGEDEGNVTSPGLGYNTLTVGAAEDKNTITWDDDTMAEISSYVEPAGREKPEVTAIGCGEWVTGTGGVPGIVITGRYSPWIYDQGCGTSYAAPIVAGGGALLIQRNTTLDSWPESEKAILIASALHNIEGDARRSEYDGAGAVDLAAADAIAANNWWGGLYVTPENFDASGNLIVRTIHLYAGERARLVLAYDGNPSADYTSEVLEGDLDLYLLDASATVVASSSGVDSWEIIDYTVPTEGDYTVRIHNFGGSLSGSEWTYAGFAIWPGHYVLQAYTPQTRDTPPGAWNRDSGDDYRLTRGSFWNAVGIRSPSTGDYDIYMFNNSVYGDPADHALLEDSTMANIPVDFTVIDGNHAPAGDYYATVSTFSGTGNYNIEHATHSADVLTGAYGPFSMTAAQVLRVWDAWQDAGVRKYYALRPTSGDANLGMGLFDSDPATSTTWYQGRSQYVAGADVNGAGGAELMNYQTATADWHGLVVWNSAATTTTSFILYADTDAPTGTIAVNSGAAAVNTTAVTLNLSATDAQTGVIQMRFSNDNTTWSSWVPYAATYPWTLTAGEGTKTVYAQFMNNVEMASASVSDTILLDTTAPSGAISINSGAAYSNTTAVTLNLSASDALSGVAQMQFSNNGSTFSAPVAYAASYAWSLTAGDGTKTVYVRYIDAAGNVSGSFSDTIILDTAAPSGTIVINSGAAYTAGTSVTLTLSATDGLSGVAQMRLSNDGASWTGWVSYSTGGPWTLDMGDGTKTVYIQYRDTAGNASGSFTDTIILDTTAPTGTVSINAGAAFTASTNVTLTLSASDALSGVAQMRFSNDGSTWSAWVAYATSYPWTLTGGDAPKTVYVQFRDALNNTSGDIPDTITLDTTAPVGGVSINSGAAYVNILNVTLTLSATDGGLGSGVAQMRFSNDNATWGGWIAYATSAAWTLSSGDGLKIVYVQYRDALNNTSGSYTDTITLDTVDPTGSVSINAGAAFTGSTAVTLTLSADDPGSAVAQMRFSNDNATWSGWVAYAASSAWTLSAGDGIKTVYVQYRDNAGNDSVSFTDTIALDTTAPAGSIVVNGGDAFTATTNVTLTLSASDAGSGVTHMRFSNDGSSWTGWETYATSRAWTLTAVDGIKTVYVQYRDALNNASGSFTDTITLDTTAPSGTIVINAGAAYTTSTAVTLTLSASDAGSGVAQMRFSNDSSTWSGWESYATTRAWTLLTGDGPKTVYVQYRDALNNASGSFTDGISLDATGPTGTLSINAGAAYTNNTAVALTLAASDVGSSVAQMRFSNDGSAWSPWEPYAAGKAWSIPAGDGTAMVYAQFNDLNGNISSNATDTILLDTLPPSSSATSPAQVAGLSFTVSWSGSDTLSGIASYDVQYRVGAAGMWTDWLSGTTAASAVFGPGAPVAVTPGETYYFRVRAHDGAGNLEAYPGGDGDTHTFIAESFPVFLPLVKR